VELRIAFATDDGEIFNYDHFGNAKQYLVYRFSDDGARLVETRSNIEFQEDETRKSGDPAKARAMAQLLQGIDVLVGSRFGPNITRLVKKFVCAVVRGKSIADGVEIVRSHLDEVLEQCGRTEGRTHLVLRAG
jgi:predicted Fe-Mo cluster-binding NifX family protein